MTTDAALELVKHMLTTATVVSAPVLGVALLVGLLVSIFQVVTQIQEMTLTFVPKILSVVGIIFIFGAWMLGGIVAYTEAMFRQIAELM
ncbi:flagellar biosynthesis protein FliQ [Microbulbifer rhizosphaerae]|uniref:Flagellar biosynthetic protein FliQ n=1 Tax=Microbulbifer rhizosphaerae TaxID=1562603 RepID=A0A7W4ZCJ0_9GAMM|nr:flagellar biosynthesis protein FliQ [Microbulbifer rhizosphaerae]MBB3063479.1 flagellar biosynthetic protein FliQ [Microbulbifer rhizosphaerae]